MSSEHRIVGSSPIVVILLINLDISYFSYTDLAEAVKCELIHRILGVEYF